VKKRGVSGRYFLFPPIEPPIARCGGLLFFALFGVSCDQSFDPRPLGSASPIVYSILATDKPDQYVRVFSTYPPDVHPPGSNTIEYTITDATVTLDGAPLVLATLPRVDSTRYTTPIYAYRTVGLTIQYGATYTLVVQTPTFGTLTSTITIPSKPIVLMNQRPILEHPESYLPTTKLQMTASIPKGAKAFLFRLLVVYDVLEPNGWERRRTEIPARFKSDPPTLSSALYGQVTRVQTPSVANAYTVSVYSALLDDIYELTKPYKAVFNYVVLQFVQLDEHFYNYYTSVKGFEDPFSIRLDQSNYSNIKNGAGIFGGYSVDSLFQILPADFMHNRR
jgi:hypothetical protein